MDVCPILVGVTRFHGLSCCSNVGLVSENGKPSAKRGRKATGPTRSAGLPNRQDSVMDQRGYSVDPSETSNLTPAFPSPRVTAWAGLAARRSAIELVPAQREHAAA